MSNEIRYIVGKNEKLSGIERRRYINIAKQLKYGDEVVSLLETSTTYDQADRIMATARCR